jgi:hypothetical protein
MGIVATGDMAALRNLLPSLTLRFLPSEHRQSSVELARLDRPSRPRRIQQCCTLVGYDLVTVYLQGSTKWLQWIINASTTTAFAVRGPSIHAPALITASFAPDTRYDRYRLSSAPARYSSFLPEVWKFLVSGVNPLMPRPRITAGLDPTASRHRATFL